ncbi:exosome complex component MTR3-like [Toxorhynchites rutilus septentrionalis]|uniref:exosome complex component MTR3-like n=1 Tax=Toxorhynchites rutilus septentrionalis TaxID=329112 RepID=UPI0024786049|nr:exosome complex component MTR3-like [Toxorhynchites rutilus septentrionalis]
MLQKQIIVKTEIHVKLYSTVLVWFVLDHEVNRRLDKLHRKVLKMPVDLKRINGPEGSVPYQIFSKNRDKTFEERLAEVFNSSGRRKCDRKKSESRKYFMKLGVVSTAKGSAYLELGNTKVIVSVFDPREIPKQNKFSELGVLYCDFKFSPFACTHRKNPQTDAEERSLAAALTKALQPVVCRHLFPNFQIDIFANVLEDDGSVLGAVITAAGLALSDATISMFDIVTASTVAVFGDNIYLDPTLDEQKICLEGGKNGNHGIITMAKLHTLDQISEMRQIGNITQETLMNACKRLNEANNDVAPVVQQMLIGKVQRHLSEIDLDDDDEKDGATEDLNKSVISVDSQS